MKPLDVTGVRFSRLTGIEKAYPAPKRQGAVWRWLCDCGAVVLIRAKDVTRGNTKSCGCQRRDVTRALKTKHGHTRQGRPWHPLYVTWASMINRCTNPKNQAYALYGGRGISVCERWRHSFPNWLEDMGPRPEGKGKVRPAYSVDRINNDGNYEPANCRWATWVQQRHNRRDVL